MYFDTHAHYDDEAFDEDRDALLPRLNAGGVELIIDPGCDLRSSCAAIALAEKYSFVYAAVGVHRKISPGFLWMSWVRYAPSQSIPSAPQ